MPRWSCRIVKTVIGDTPTISVCVFSQRTSSNIRFLVVASTGRPDVVSGPGKEFNHGAKFDFLHTFTFESLNALNNSFC